MAIYSKKSKSKQNIDKNLKLKIGVSLIVIFSLLFINLAFNVLALFNSFFLGTFGLLTYAMFLCGIGVGVLLVLNKSYTISKMDILLFSIWLILFVAILHLATTTKLPITSYGKYISSAYSYKLSAGGVIFAIISYPLLAFTHSFVSAIVLFTIALIIASTVIIIRYYDYYQLKQLTPTTNDVDMQEEVAVTKPATKSIATTEKIQEFDDNIFIDDAELEELEKSNKITELTTTEKDKIKAKSILGLSKEQNSIEENTSKTKVNDIFNVTNKPKTDSRPPRYIHEEKPATYSNASTSKKNLSDRERANLEYLRVITGRSLPDEETNTSNANNSVENRGYNTYNLNNNVYNNPYEQNTTTTETNYYSTTPSNVTQNKPSRTPFTFEDTTITENKPVINSNLNTNTFDNVNNFEEDNDNDIYDENLTYNSVKTNSYNQTPSFKKPPIIKEEVYEEVNLNPIQTSPKKMEQIIISEVATEKHNDKPKYKKPYHYVKPPIELLNVVHNPVSYEEENLSKGQALEEKLASLRFPAKVVNIKRGPAFSQFEMQAPTGIQSNKILSLNSDIKMAVQANGNIRIEMPIPGKSTFGIEVPNEQIDMVGLRDIIESNNFTMSKSPLTFGLGKDIAGDCKVARLDKLVHLLVAGATGSGKSVCLNTMLISFLYHTSPEDVKLILVDPKQVEFTAYNGLPHLLIPEVITDPNQAVMMLDWACNEMERRYKLLSNLRVKNLAEYNDKNEVKDGICEKLPYLVIILDEVGDLMSTHKKEIEDKIVRLGQKSRAAGIHLVLATQRPSADVITGTIKANIPSKIAFAVSSFENSKIIIGCSGAEHLLGRGDMLYSDQASPDLKRIQGAYVSNEEIENIVNFIKENNECIFDSDIEDAMFNPKNNSFSADSPRDEAYDPMLIDAVRVVLRTNKASISGIQRALGVGYPKAGKLIDQMERAGFISEADSKNNRVIFVTPQEFEEKFGEEY